MAYAKFDLSWFPLIVILGQPVEKWNCIYTECQALCCRLSRALTPKDIKNIREKTGKKLDDFVETTSGPMPFRLKLVDGKCVFLNEDFSCKLHPLNAKPLLCKIYPFLLDKVFYGEEPIVQLAPVKECPGYGVGEKLDDAFFSELSKIVGEYLEELRRVVSLKKSGLSPREILERLL